MDYWPSMTATSDKTRYFDVAGDEIWPYPEPCAHKDGLFLQKNTGYLICVPCGRTFGLIEED